MTSLTLGVRLRLSRNRRRFEFRAGLRQRLLLRHRVSLRFGLKRSSVLDSLSTTRTVFISCTTVSVFGCNSPCSAFAIVCTGQRLHRFRGSHCYPQLDHVLALSAHSRLRRAADCASARHAAIARRTRVVTRVIASATPDRRRGIAAMSLDQRRAAICARNTRRPHSARTRSRRAAWAASIMPKLARRPGIGQIEHWLRRDLKKNAGVRATFIGLPGRMQEARAKLQTRRRVRSVADGRAQASAAPSAAPLGIEIGNECEVIAAIEPGEVGLEPAFERGGRASSRSFSALSGSV